MAGPCAERLIVVICLRTQVLSYFASIIFGRKKSEHPSSQGLSENKCHLGLPLESERGRERGESPASLLSVSWTFYYL